MIILGTNANENKKSFMPKAIFDFATMGEILMIQFSGAIFVYLPIFLSNFCDQIMSIKAISLTWKRRSTKQRISTPPVDLNQGEFFLKANESNNFFLNFFARMCSGLNSRQKFNEEFNDEIGQSRNWFNR